MIFYFSGTGNSRHVAEKLANGGTLVSMGEALREGAFNQACPDGEPLGFVMPVYFMGIPAAVRRFMRRLERQVHTPPYVFVVFTCGGVTGDAAGMFRKALAQHGLSFQASFGVRMPDNYLPLFKAPPKPKQARQIADADAECVAIAEKIAARAEGDFNRHRGLFPKLVTRLAYRFYDRTRRTAKFAVSDACTGCGQCEALCPERAIVLTHGRPVWVKPDCSLCLGCLQCCPVGCIDFGSKTKGRTRYRFEAETGSGQG